MGKSKTNNVQKSKSAQGQISEFELRKFFPYLVRVFHVAVSQSLSEIYKNRLKISVNEWRTMAVLGLENEMSASEIVTHSSMDKVVVSRAVKGLSKLGFLKRKIDQKDRRRTVLCLSNSGKKAFLTVLPLVQQREKEMLKGFSEEEKHVLTSLMSRVQRNAENLKTDD